MNESYKISRERAIEIADAIINANFRVFGIGHFDISFDEFVNIIMISNNYGNNATDKLNRYYEILERKHMPSYYGREQCNLKKIEIILNQNSNRL